MLSTIFLSLAIAVPLPELPVSDLTPAEVESIITKEMLSQGYENTCGVAWIEQDWQGRWRCCVGYERDGAFRDLWFSGDTYRECLQQFYENCLGLKL